MSQCHPYLATDLFTLHGQDIIYSGSSGLNFHTVENQDFVVVVVDPSSRNRLPNKMHSMNSLAFLGFHSIDA